MIALICSIMGITTVLSMILYLRGRSCKNGGFSVLDFILILCGVGAPVVYIYLLYRAETPFTIIQMILSIVIACSFAVVGVVTFISCWMRCNNHYNINQMEERSSVRTEKRKYIMMTIVSVVIVIALICLFIMLNNQKNREIDNVVDGNVPGGTTPATMMNQSATSTIQQSESKEAETVNPAPEQPATNAAQQPDSKAAETVSPMPEQPVETEPPVDTEPAAVVVQTESLPGAAITGEWYCITSVYEDGIALHPDPDADSAVLDRLSCGTEFYAERISGTYVYTDYNGQYGWINTEYAAKVSSIVIDTDADNIGDWYVITSNYARGIALHPIPDADSGTLVRLPKGTEFCVEKMSGTYAYINYNGQYGWINLEYASLVD